MGAGTESGSGWLIDVRHQYLNVTVSHTGFEYLQLAVAGLVPFPVSASNSHMCAAHVACNRRYRPH
jgi:hypothetical protein